MTPKRIKVLHVLQSLNYGGMERLVADMVMLADRTTFDLHVMGLQYLGRFSAGLAEHAGLHVGPKMSRGSIIYPRALASSLRQIAPDVVHTHSGVWLKASLAARLAGVPALVHTEHGRASPDPLSARIIEGIGARLSHRVVAVSQPLMKHLHEKLHVPMHKLRVIINGVNTEQIARTNGQSLRSELGIAEDVAVLGSVGRLEPIKGYDVAVRALAEMPASLRAVLIVGGDGTERARLVELARSLGVDHRVFLLGWRDDIERIHQASTIFTMSSRSEGTSVSLLEAMNAKLCPVVTDVGGNRAVLGQQLSHRLVPSENPAALAQAWTDALTDRAAAQRDASLARERVIAEFSSQRMVREYEQIYRELMSGV